jgi:hypothetical protein
MAEITTPTKEISVVPSSERPVEPPVSALPHWWVRTLRIQLHGRTDLLDSDTTIVATTSLAGPVKSVLLLQVQEAGNPNAEDLTVLSFAAKPSAQPSVISLAHPQQSGGIILPVGAAARPALQLGKRIWPLPGARFVLVIDPPVHVPAGSGSALSDWQRTLTTLLQRADGLAADHLATWIGNRTHIES